MYWRRRRWVCSVHVKVRRWWRNVTQSWTWSNQLDPACPRIRILLLLPRASISNFMNGPGASFSIFQRYELNTTQEVPIKKKKQNGQRRSTTRRPARVIFLQRLTSLEGVINKLSFVILWRSRSSSSSLEWIKDQLENAPLTKMPSFQHDHPISS